MILDKEQSIGIQEILRTVDKKKQMTYYINITFPVFYNFACVREWHCS